MATVLIVEDEKNSRDALAELIRADGFDTETAATLAEAESKLQRGTFDLVLLDLQLPDGSAMGLLTELARRGETEVVIITGHATVDTAVEALQAGAADYLTKPIDMTRLKAVLAKTGATAELRQELNELRGELRRLGRFGEMLGASPAMQKVYDLLTRVAPTDTTVLLTGPTGVGKELAARMVHRLSRRAKKPFVAINCAAVPATLIESELFGHEKGAFTGAERRHHGVFERADGGTLLLDELSELPIELQAKLLRVLETSTFSRVGSEKTEEFDARIIAAMNRPPQQALAEGTLREDLHYRLNVFPVDLPPLRAREGDVELLATSFLADLNRTRADDGGKAFTLEAIERLRGHSWPGNVRELKNLVERAFILAEHDRIEPHHLPLPDAPVDGDAAGAPVDGQGIVFGVGTSIADAERRLILQTLEHVGGSRKEAARLLGISKKTLYNRLKDYGV